jgi:antitoxin ParD1/3/4
LGLPLTPEMAAVVRQAVESGDYASNSEIVREALRDWKLKRALQQQEVEELRRLWQEGLHSGPSRFAGMADLKAEARRRLEAQSQPGA